MEPIPDVEPILIVIVVVLLFGGGYWGRRHGHW
jgi:cobalamin biosynthesis Mg chelatase CobN